MTHVGRGRILQKSPTTLRRYLYNRNKSRDQEKENCRTRSLLLEFGVPPTWGPPAKASVALHKKTKSKKIVDGAMRCSLSTSPHVWTRRDAPEAGWRGAPSKGSTRLCRTLVVEMVLQWTARWRSETNAAAAGCANECRSRRLHRELYGATQ